MSRSTTVQGLLLGWVLVPQLLLLGLGQGAVVCVAPGGHLQLEFASRDCCTEAQAPAGAESQEAGAGGPDCNACSDLPLGSDSLSARTSGPDPEQGHWDAPSALPSVEVGGPPPHPPVRDVVRERGHISPHLVRLRSTVLRC